MKFFNLFSSVTPVIWTPADKRTGLRFLSATTLLINFYYHVLMWFFPVYMQNFLVDIKGPAVAFLPVLAFEGGTRRNIPKFEV